MCVVACRTNSDNLSFAIMISIIVNSLCSNVYCIQSKKRKYTLKQPPKKKNMPPPPSKKERMKEKHCNFAVHFIIKDGKKYPNLLSSFMVKFTAKFVLYFTIKDDKRLGYLSLSFMMKCNTKFAVHFTIKYDKRLGCLLSSFIMKCTANLQRISFFLRGDFFFQGGCLSVYFIPLILNTINI